MLPRLLVDCTGEYFASTDTRATTITVVLHELPTQRPIPHGGING